MVGRWAEPCGVHQRLRDECRLPKQPAQRADAFDEQPRRQGQPTPAQRGRDLIEFGRSEVRGVHVRCHSSRRCEYSMRRKAPDNRPIVLQGEQGEQGEPSQGVLQWANNAEAFLLPLLPAPFAPSGDPARLEKGTATNIIRVAKQFGGWL